MCIVKHGISQHQYLVPFFSFYMSTVNSKFKPIPFADVTSISIYHSNIDCYQNSINVVFADMNKWFKADTHTLNFVKADLMKFATGNKICQIK
jgi:hypothetical protein